MHITRYCKSTDKDLGILPFVAYHHVIIVWLAISIILFCKFALPTITESKAGHIIYMGRRMFQRENVQ